MHKKSGNPKVEELTKSCRARHTNLDGLKAIKLESGQRLCAWCAEGKLHHGNQKYCSQDCSQSAMAWAYPQKEEALFFLLVRQEWKCNVCKHDYRSLAENIHQQYYSRYGGAEHQFGEKYDYYLVKVLKSRCDKEHRLEVDHIIPIFKNGNSLGIDNHQAICYTCHKTKTSKDLTKEKV